MIHTVHFLTRRYPERDARIAVSLALVLASVLALGVGLLLV